MMTYMTNCLDCQANLDHCHGTFIIHGDDSTECSETWCRLDANHHEFKVHCTELAGCADCFEWTPEYRHAA